MKAIYTIRRNLNKYGRPLNPSLSRITWLLALLLLGSVAIYSQPVTFTSNTTWQVPAGVSEITVEAWGGGGAGGYTSGSFGTNVAGGGGGGAFASSLLSVNPGDIYTITIGNGGSGSSGASPGGNTIFGSNLVVAAGGAGLNNNANTGGQGGQTSDCIYNLNAFNGGNGGNASGSNSGAGGGGAGSTESGANGSGTTAGSGGDEFGGDGGAGRTNNGDGFPGNIYGGGGGGGRVVLDFANNGGNGATGFMRITWVLCANPDIPTLQASPTSICDGDNSTLSITAGDLNDATDWHWYSGSCGGTPIGTGTSVIVSPSVTATYYVRGEGGCVTPGACAEITVTVLAPPQITVQPGTPAAVCQTGGVRTISVTASGDGLSYQWRKDNINLTASAVYSDVDGATLTITNPPLSENGASFDVVVSGSCPPTPVTSDAVILTVDAAADGGSLTGGSTPICDGSSTGTLSLAGHSGTIVRWEKRVDAGSWDDIAHTGTTYSEVPDSPGTWDYRVRVENGSCFDYSNLVTIVVDPATVAGSVSGGSTICLTENTGILTLGGYTGSILRWQKRLDGGGWQDIVHTNDTYSEVPSSVGSWDYRAEVQSGVCAAGFSAHTTVTVNANSVGGSVSGGNTPICLGESTGTMTLSGHTGTVNKWQRRLDGGGWADIVNATTTHSEIPASAGTWDYRAEVQNGSCAAEFSGFTSIVVLPRPTAVLSGSGSICLGQAVTLTLSVTAVGDWELNLDNGGGTFTGNGSGSFPAVVYPPTNTTYSITDMFDSQCTSEPGDLTGSATINVDEDCQVIYINAPDPLEAEISGTETICSGETVTITVTLSGGNQPWSIFVMPSTLYDNITGTEPFDFTFQVTPSSSITYDNTNIFVGDDEGCAPTVTGSAVITVYDEILFTVDYADISCFGANDGEITVTVTQGTAPFEFSIDNGQNYTSPQASPYTFTGLGPGDYDIRVRDASGCESPECP